MRQFAATAMVGLLLALTACGDPDSQEASSLSAGAASSPGRSAAQPNSSQEKRLAISHTYTVRLPSRDVEGVQQAHLATCAALGCTVLNTRLDRSNEGRIAAWSSVRIAPDVYEAFAAAVAHAPSEIIAPAESAEDKTLPILDLERRLEVKVALRDRLNAMLRDTTKKTPSDLAAIEKELAQVQGDIEIAIAQRDYLRTVTETVKVDIYYTGTTAQAGGFDLSPIQRAVSGLGKTIVSSVATLIAFVAAAVPWLPFIALIAWGVRVGYRRWKASKPQSTAG